MTLYESGEDYLETILILEKRLGQVRSIDVATELDVSKPSVSVATKKLRENGYLENRGGGDLLLTPKGREVAQEIYARHKFLTSLFESIGVSSEVAEADACRIEHYLSQETFDRIKDHVRQIGLID